MFPLQRTLVYLVWTIDSLTNGDYYYEVSDNGDYTRVGSDDGTSWSDAENHCMTLFGTHLCSFHSQADNDDAFGDGTWFTEYNAIWIGLNDIETEGDYQWIDGTPFDFANWQGKQDSTVENCVRINVNTGQWNDIGCETLYFAWCCNHPNPPTSNPSNYPTNLPTNPSNTPTNMPTILPTSEPSYQPTSQPSKQPSYQPTSVPSGYPSGYPSDVPSSVPSKFPSSYPSEMPTDNVLFSSFGPSSVPSEEPSVQVVGGGGSSHSTQVPTRVPTRVPSSHSDDSDDVSSGGDGSAVTGEDNGGSGNDSLFDNEWIVVVLIIGGFISCIICLILLFCYFDRKHKRKNKERLRFDSSHSASNLTSQSSNNNRNNINANYNSIELAQMQTATMQPINSSSVRGESAQNNRNNNNNSINSNDLLVSLAMAPQPQINANRLITPNGIAGQGAGGAPDMIDAMIATEENGSNMDINEDLREVFADLTDMNGIIPNNNNRISVAAAHANMAGEEGMSADGAGVTGGPVPGAVGNNNSYNNNVCGPGADTSAIHMVNESDNLTQKEVLLLVKSHLIKNDFEQETILRFLKEFATKHVTGQDLRQFKKNRKLMDTFQMGFSKENQVLSVWLIVHMIINDIGRK